VHALVVRTLKLAMQLESQGVRGDVAAAGGEPARDDLNWYASIIKGTGVRDLAVSSCYATSATGPGTT
jgi:hypothetical protein